LTSVLKKNRFTLFIAPIILGIALGYYAYRVHAINGLADNAIRSDGTGYYAYLPAVFIYHDLQFGFLDDKRLVNDDGASRVTLKNGKIVNKYACGLAILQIPFFFIAYFLSFLFHQPIDGYNDIFQYFFLLGNTVYFTLGLIYLNKILRFYKIRIWLTLLVLILFTAGNSILHYTTYDAYLSHAFSLGLMICLVYQILRFNRTPQKNYAIAIGVIYGLLVLIRPFNLIAIICLPILFNHRKQFLHFFKRILPFSFYIITPFLFTVSIQFILWKLQTGDFLVYSYGNEKFIWGTHDPLFALIGYRRGFFIYNPIWAIALIYFLFKAPKLKFSLLFTFLSFGVLVFLLSSWHAKLYGMSLGYRPLLEYQIFLLFPLLHLHEQKSINLRVMQIALPIISGVCIWYSITIGLQYQQNILRWEGPNKAEYWEIFGQTDSRYNYHFFYPEQLIKSEYNTLQIPFDNKAVLSDTGFTFNLDSFPKLKIKGVGYYADIKTSKPHFATGVLDFQKEEKTLFWKHKLISKDIKTPKEYAPFYIDEIIKDSSINSVTIKFLHLKEIKEIDTRNEQLILFYEAFKPAQKAQANDPT